MLPFARFLFVFILHAPWSCGSERSENDTEGLMQIHTARLVDDPVDRSSVRRDPADRADRRLHRRHGRQRGRRYGYGQRTTTTTTLLPNVIKLMKDLEASREALGATFSTLADSLAGSDARLVRDFSNKWLGASGGLLLVTEFVTNYAANASYGSNNVGLLDALSAIVDSLSGPVSLLQSGSSAVDENLAENCVYLASYANPVFGDGELYDMLTELQNVCSNDNVAAALPAAAEPNAAALIAGANVLETGDAPTTTQRVSTTTTTPTTTAGATSTSRSSVTAATTATATSATTATATATITTTTPATTTAATTVTSTTVATMAPTTTTAPTTTAATTAGTTTSADVDRHWVLGPGGGSCDDVCGIGLCDLTKQESVTSDELMTISISLGRQCASVNSWPNPYSPEIDSSQTCWRASGSTTCSADTTDIRHQRFCYCTMATTMRTRAEPPNGFQFAQAPAEKENSLIQIEAEPPKGFQLVEPTADSSPVEGAVFTGMARFESSCSNPKECYDIYRFGGCVSSASGWLPTDQTYWGVVSADNATPSVRWENQAPSPVPFAAHTVVGKDQDHALVLGGLTSCGEDAAHQNFLWQWRRTDGSWDQLTPIPEPCGLAFHTAHYFRDQGGRNGMVVFGGLHGTSGSGCTAAAPVVSDSVWWFDFQTLTWSEKKIIPHGVWGHASTLISVSNLGKRRGLCVHGGRMQDGSIDNTVRLYPLLGIISGPGKEIKPTSTSNTGPQRMFHTMMQFGRTSFGNHMKVTGGVRPTSSQSLPFSGELTLSSRTDNLFFSGVTGQFYELLWAVEENPADDPPRTWGQTGLEYNYVTGKDGGKDYDFMLLGGCLGGPCVPANDLYLYRAGAQGAQGVFLSLLCILLLR
ncbi:unnamed protein product [Durusdinium trenchii]